MKKKIKKNRLKIFIALSIMFTLITTIFIGTKTFAYESANEITDTFNLNNIVLGQNTEAITIEEENYNNNTYKYIQIQHTNTSSFYMGFGVNLKEGLNYPTIINTSNYVLLMNLEFGYYNNGNWTTYVNNGGYITINVGNSANTTSFQNRISIGNYITSSLNYKYKTGIQTLFDANSNLNTTNTIYFNFRTPISASNSNYYVRVYNFDIISTDDVYTQKYIDTYYGPLEEQYNQLLENYEQLEDDYYQLNNDYTDLEQDYNTLENDYNALNNNYNSISGIATYGLWDLISNNTTEQNVGYSSIDCNLYNNNTDTGTRQFLYYTKDEFISNNYINGLKFNFTNVYNNFTLSDYTVSTFNYNIVFPNNIYNIINLDNIDMQINTNMDIDTFLDSGNTGFIYIVCQPQEKGLIQTQFGETYWYGIPNSTLKEWNYEITKEKLKTLYGELVDYYSCINRLVVNIKTSSNPSNDVFYITSLNNQYNVGYANGWVNGTNQANSTKDEQITELQRTLDVRTQGYLQTLNEKNTEITGLNLTIRELNAQLETNDSYNLNKLMWTIGGLPFESFKHIWNINFLGVNIADFVLGFITTFIGLWILKKFFL